MQTPFEKKQRALWYLSVDRNGRTVTETCQIFGISRKTYYTWRKRDFSGGGSVQQRMRRAPSNTKLTHSVRQFIEAEKRRTNYGPLKMKLLVERELGITLSTTIIYRFYKKRKLIRKPQRKLQWYAPLTERVAIDKPGVGVQLDVKYVADGRGRRRYQFSVCDPFTRLYHFEICDTRESKNAILALKNAQAVWGFTIHSVQTDNGSEFRGVFHNYLESVGVTHHFIPKKSPWWNGIVERIHRSMDDEYYCNPRRAWHSPLEWVRFYNTQRIHLGLSGLTPQEKLESVTLDC